MLQVSNLSKGAWGAYMYDVRMGLFSLQAMIPLHWACMPITLPNWSSGMAPCQCTDTLALGGYGRTHHSYYSQWQWGWLVHTMALVRVTSVQSSSDFLLFWPLYTAAYEYHSIPGKRPPPSMRPCTAFQNVKVSIQLYTVFIRIEAVPWIVAALK